MKMLARFRRFLHCLTHFHGSMTIYCGNSASWIGCAHCGRCYFADGFTEWVVRQ
jgi:hypothetical protein